MEDQQLKQHKENQQKLNELINSVGKINGRLNTMEEKLDPMYEIFFSVKGFNGVAVWILKALILLGAALGVVYGFIKYLKS